LSDNNLLIDHLFRHEAGKMVSVLTRFFGPHHLTLAEDVVQDTLVAAMQSWSMSGIPENPSAWLMRAAKNRAIDVIRRENTFKRLSSDLTTMILSEQTLVQAIDSLWLPHEIQDDQLRMMFSCCDPDISKEAQVALILRTLCGFSIPEISKLYLLGEKVIEQRLGRARKTLRNTGALFEVDKTEQIEERIGAVHETLYLLFSEGYHGSHEEALVREELCVEAMRLTKMLAEHSITGTPRSKALLALMCFHAARLNARMGENDYLVPLQFQDRSKWDRDLINMGIYWLGESSEGEQLSEFHLEAGIALKHCEASSLDSTDWVTIVSLYDLLVKNYPSPVVELNRAIAIGQLMGSIAGISALDGIRGIEKLESYPFLWAAYGEFNQLIGQTSLANHYFEKGLRTSRGKVERAFFEKKLQKKD
jgi:RNA polymerase sigma factor (sigma-70 family)